jgi:CDP-diacylglycerol--glycerol-3-phosphate 3-phosphatidyltransferase
VSFPFVLVIALLGYEKLFVVLICINLVTDVLDGFIARTFNMKTEIGAKLDSIADTGTFILAFLGLYLFRWNILQNYAFPFLLFVSLFVFCNLLSLLKFRRLPSLHLYSWKIGGYIQGAFLFTIFAIDFYAPFFYFMIVWSVLAILEHIIIQLIIEKMISNAKGLYWVLKGMKKAI